MNIYKFILLTNKYYKIILTTQEYKKRPSAEQILMEIQKISHF